MSRAELSFRAAAVKTPCSKSVRPAWLWASFAVLSLVKLWLVSGQTLYTNCDSIYDEWLFVKLAGSLLDGQWLGPYNQSTLIKGMFYPLWIAVTHATGLPLLLSQHLLYIAACFVLMIAIGPLVPHRTVFLLTFILVLFNPMSYTEGVMAATLREGIYPALTLLVVGCTLGFLVRHDGPLSKLIPWSAGLGLALSSFWLTREEGVWIVPFILFVFGLASFRACTTTSRYRSKILLCALPFTVWLVSLGIVAGMNKIHYGIFSTSESKAPSFLAAYGALCRVKHAHWEPTIPVPKETRERLYAVSPSFAALKPFLEADLQARSGDLTKKIFLERYAQDHEVRATLNTNLRLYLGKDSSDTWVKMWYSGKWLAGEAVGGDFLWPLRDAVAAAGYYSSAASASKFYGRLASEINSACSDGRLACDSERATLAPPWHHEYAVPLVRTLLSGALFLVRFENFSAHSQPSIGQEKPLAYVRKITRDRLLPAEINVAGWAFSPEAPISLSVSAKDGDPRKAAITSGQRSADVYDSFLSMGTGIQNALHSRFEIATYCTEGCFLDIKSGNHLMKRVPLDGTTRTLNTPGVRLQIDRFEYRNASKRKVRIDAVKTGILESIGSTYQFVLPLLSVAGFVLYILYTVRFFRKTTFSIPWIIATGLLIAIISRLFVISFIHVSSFPAITTRYLSPLYPLLLTFLSVVLNHCLRTLDKKRTARFS